MTLPDNVYPGMLRTKMLGRNFLYFDEIDSTNTWLKENAGTLPDGTACAAALQTHGKGRLGRNWLNQKGSGLMFSLLSREYEPSAMSALPLVVGLGVSLAIDKLSGLVTQIKWSNDVLINGKKLCGILCESRLNRDGGFAVIGIGVNLTHTRSGLDALGLVYATSLLLATDNVYNDLAVAAAILNELESMLERYRIEGFAPFRVEYASRCITLGHEVLLLSPAGLQKKAEALDIGNDGSLICSLSGKIETVAAGEVSVRGLYGYV